jgi:hypothetical protein
MEDFGQHTVDMMRLSERERRTVRIAGLGLGIYLGLFCGIQVWRGLEARRDDYARLVTDARRAAAELVPQENRVMLARKLKEDFGFDPRTTDRATLVANASAAIQQAARGGGVQVATLRESSARASARELATMQFEGMGPVPGVLGLLHRLGTLGYPLILDAVQISSDPKRPGMVKLNLTIVILDFAQWQGKEAPRA